MAPSLHPTGVNHLAISTSDMKSQLEFWCDVLGCPLKALYWMHGVDGCYHGFVELSGNSYVAFVQHPDNSSDVEYGVTHAGNPGAPVTAGTMQHVAFHVETLEEVLEMRDRIRSRGVQVMGPLDHGFVKSIYFAGPEGLSLEVSCGSNIDAEAWIDPEVTGLCEISDHELGQLKSPEPFDRPADPVPQPAYDPAKPNMNYPGEVRRMLMGMPDELVWKKFSETTPPVQDD